MRRWLSIPILIGVLMFCSPSRSETIIDFDALMALECVTDQFQPLGVTFGTDVTDTLCNLIVPNGGLAQSPPNVLASAFDSNDGVISFSFLPPVIQAAFTAVSIEDGLSVNYFDPQGTLLFTDSHPGTGNFFTPVDFSYSNPAGIGSVVAVVPDESHADPFAIDDVIFVVPEPATLSVSAFLLLALAGRRPRRSHL